MATNDKISYNDIRNKHEDWSRDPRNNKKYSGASVQKFIKDTFEGKVGCIYYDPSTSKYLCFADIENRDLYVSDPVTYSAMLLGSFDAPANYTAEITLTTPTSNTMLKGETGKYIDFTFDITNKSGASTGDSVVCTITFNNSGNKKVVTQVYSAGTSVHFLCDQYLEDGTNTVTINIVGRSTLAGTTSVVMFTVVDLKLSSNFDFSVPVTGDNLAVPYTLEGAGVKYLQWYIDGVVLGVVDDITDLKVTRTKNIDITELSEGRHNVQVRAYITSNGVNYYSKTLYFNFYKYVETQATSVLLGMEVSSPQSGALSSGVVQYGTASYKLAVFDSRSRALAVSVKDNNVSVQSIATEPLTIEELTYSPVDSGEHIILFTADEATNSITFTVSQSDIGISEATEDLTLRLSAKGRSNAEVSPGVWDYGVFHTTFNNFSWNEQSGWNNGSLVIPSGSSIDIDLAPLSGNPSQVGRTIEIDYETADVEDEDASVLELVNSETNAGLSLTASSASLQSSGGAVVNTKYRGGDRIHLAFIINKTEGDNACLMFIVNNGILERAASFASADTFACADYFHIGSTGCKVILHSIRVYDRNITVEEAFGNFAVDADNILEVANRNDILNTTTGKIDADKVNAKLPIIIITGDMNPIFNTTDKNTTVYVDMEYRNMQDPTKSFTATHVRMRPQGTSSLGYPRKNLRPYTASKYGCTMYDYEGNVLENGLYAFKDGSQPVNCWTLKADYAESSGSHNTGVARIWNTLMYNAQMDNTFPLRTAAQNAAIANNYNYDVRTTVDGFPIVVFWRMDENSEMTCLGQYNFNNDKSTEKVFGFTDIPGFDNSHVQCFEFLANENPICLFDDVSNFDSGWSDAFESRYPDTKTPNLVPLKTLATWINSCKNNQQKWNDEKASHFDLPKLAAYYVYLMRFGAVDQTVKNAMLETEDGVHWFFINYDNDTILGIDNISTVLNRWDYTRDTQKGTNTYYFAGHASVLWNCFEADPECMALVSHVDDALYSAGLTYLNLCNMFDSEQCDKWCERMYNDNGDYKYIQPYKDSGSAVLYMLQGSRKSYRHWWLQHRMDMYDAMWATGTFKSRIFRFIAEGAQNKTVTFKAAKSTYYGYGINSVPQQIGVQVNAGSSQTFTIVQTLAIGDPVALYNANNISELDLSDFVEYLNTLYINTAIGADGKSNLKKLILGDGTHTNSIFTEIGGLNIIRGIEEIDIRNFTGMTNVNLAYQDNLHVFKAAGSGLTSFAPADGVSLTEVTLPSTLQSIILSAASVASLTYTPTTTLRSVSLSNVSGAWDAKAFVNSWLALLSDAQLGNAELTLGNINWTGMTAAQVIKMGKVGTKSYTGKVTVSSMTQAEYNQIVDLFGSNVFVEGGAFVIDAPTSVLLSINKNAMFSGDSAQLTATSFPVQDGTVIEYEMYKNNVMVEPSGGVATTDGISLNTSTGAITTTNAAEGNVTFKAKATNGGEYVRSSEVSLQVQVLTYPASVNIAGAGKVFATGLQNYTKSFDTNNFTASVLNVVWSLSSNPACTLASQTSSGASVNVVAVSSTLATVTLTCVVTFTGNVTRTGTKTIKIKEVGYNAVDLGLTSGKLWADCNIGAFSEEDDGLYFAWGETTGYVDAAARGTGGFDQTSYNNGPAASINADLTLAQDAANVNMGGTWHMPTKADFDELIADTDQEWVSNYNSTGVSGYKFKNKSDSTKFIFIPASGYLNGASQDEHGSYGIYWSSTFLDSNSAYNLYFNSGSVNTRYYNRRYGFTIRGIKDAPVIPTYEKVDLGLPSGKLWANMNVGATSETGDGLYFAWGETTGYADAAARGSGGFDQTSYDAGSAASISADLTLLNDAARFNMGGSWRMPTYQEFQELYDSNNTDQEWATINGVSGWKFMKKSDHSVYVFFPASGYWDGTSQNNHGSYGLYWSSSFYNSTGAYNLNFLSGSVYTGSNRRRCGMTVRAICDAPPTMVDLGLPSGLLWANTNLGATSETGDGEYFAWGETQGYLNADHRNAVTGLTGGFDQTSYNAGSASSISDNLTLAQDAANNYLGGNYRMPTKAEFDELINSNNTDQEWTTINGVSGYKFMKKSDHSVYVFFPASGFWDGTSQSLHGSDGYYWSSTFYNSTSAYYLYFYSGSVYTNYKYYYRRYGLTIRPVLEPPPPPSKVPVDLGLPSGLKWAQANIGAASETDDGLYFAWGETTGYADATARNAATGGTGGFDDASYNAGPAVSISANLTSSNDAAAVNLGGSWRMPTKDEFDELINSNNTDKEWTSINGVSGWKFMKKSDHSVYVFFPASGYWNDTSQGDRGSDGYYWSSTFYDSSRAYFLNFNSGIVGTHYYSRRFGFPVRAVQ